MMTSPLHGRWWQGHPALALAFLAGVLWLMTRPDLPAPGWLAATLLVLPAWRWPWWRPMAALAAGFSLALFHAQVLVPQSVPSAMEGMELEVEGRVASLPEQEGRVLRFVLDVERVTAPAAAAGFSGRVRLSWFGPPRGLELHAGQRWRLSVKLKAPQGFMNPGGFDYEGWLYREHIRATGSVRTRQPYERLDAGPGAAWLTALREDIGARIAAALPDAPLLGVVQALVTGDTRAVSAAQWEVFRRTGTGHLIAISGTHVALIAGLAYGLGQWLWRRRTAWCLWLPAPLAGAAAALLLATAYAGLAGFAIPTQRALVMLAALLGAQLLRRQVRGSDSLALALIAVLAFDPAAVLSAGFWLSYGAVAVILYVAAAPAVSGGRLLAFTRLQLAITLALLPITLALFQQASVVAPLANLPAVPWITVVSTPLALGGAALQTLWPAGGGWLLQVAAWSLDLAWLPLERMAAWPQALWSAPQPQGWMLALALAGIVWLLAPRAVPARAAGSLLLLPLLLHRAPAPPPGGFDLHLLDVGQGLAAVVRTAQHSLLFDTGPGFGGDFDAGRAAVLPFLRSLGAAQADVLLLSHGDLDHSGGAASVLAGLPVARLISNERDKLPQEAAARALPCEQGQSWEWDGVRFEVLHPPPGGAWRGNDASCVLRVSGAAGAALLTGDIEAGAERWLLAHADTAGALDSDVLIAPHHGSKTSSTVEFIAAVSPLHVLYPAGYRNRFGHPRPEVRGRYQTAGAREWLSYEHGTLSFAFRPGQPPPGPSAHRADARRFWHWRPTPGIAD
jgi:competence protein ComEC